MELPFSMRPYLRLLPTIWLAACGSQQPLTTTPPVAFPLPSGVTLVDAQSGASVPAATLLTRMTSADFVLLGEVHDNEAQHRLRGELITALATRRPAVVFEQFTARDVPIERPSPGSPIEPWLDQQGFDRKGWRWPLHQAVVDAAIAHARSLWGSNMSREARRAVVRGGDSAAPASYQALMAKAPLDSAGRAAIDAELFEGHCGKLPASMVPGMRSAQVVRDAAMTDALVRAGQDGPAWLVAGNGHVRRDMGVPRILSRAAPGKSVLVVGLLEREADGTAPSAESRRPYDYVFITPRAEREDPCAGLGG
jgi:uncharacterized iron-regulated protein